VNVLLVPAHPGFPGQIPQSRKTVVCTLPTEGMPSTAMNMMVCLYVCLSVCLAVSSHISKTTWPNFSGQFSLEFPC